MKALYQCRCGKLFRFNWGYKAKLHDPQGRYYGDGSDKIIICPVCAADAGYAVPQWKLEAMNDYRHWEHKATWTAKRPCDSLPLPGEVIEIEQIRPRVILPRGFRLKRKDGKPIFSMEEKCQRNSSR